MRGVLHVMHNFYTKPSIQIGHHTLDTRYEAYMTGVCAQATVSADGAMKQTEEPALLTSDDLHIGHVIQVGGTLYCVYKPCSINIVKIVVVVVVSAVSI